MKRNAARKPSRAAQKRPAARKVQPIPDNYNVVMPYLPIRGAAAAIEFYRKAFGANERMRMPGPEGKLGHAEVQIGDSVVMLADEYASMDFLGPQSRGGTTVTIHLYVKDVDATVARAAALGAKVVRPVADQFYGDRTATIEDPFGHVWHVATHTEDVPPKELKRRAAEMAAKAPG
jgi:PhnB protein